MDSHAVSSRTLQWTAAVFVCAVAFVLRAGIVDDVRFSGDEAAHYSTARAIADLERLPALGPPNSTGGRLPGPLFYWIMAVPQFFSRAPEASAILVAALGALSALLLWDGLRRHFGQWGAILSAGLFALAPWPTLASCRIWNPHVALFVATLALWAGLRVNAQPRTRLVAVFVGAVLVLPQFHLSGVMMWIAFPLLVWPVRREVNRRFVLVGLLFAILAYLPTLVSELGSGLQNTKEILARGGPSREAFGYTWVPVYVLRSMSLDVSYHLLTGYWGGLDEAAAFRSLVNGTDALPKHPLRSLALLVSILLAFLAAAVSVFRTFIPHRAQGRDTTHALFLSFAVGMAGTIALLAVSGQRIFGHYVICLIPLAFALFAVLGRDVAVTGWGRAAIIASMIIFAVGGVDATLAVAQRVDAKRGLAVKRAVIERLYQDAREDGVAHDEPIRLDFGFQDSLYTYDTLAGRTYRDPLHFSNRGVRRYRLQELTQPVPRRARPVPLRVGAVVLYRLD